MIVLIYHGALVVIGILIFIGLAVAVKMFAAPLPKQPQETDEQRERLERWRGKS